MLNRIITIEEFIQTINKYLWKNRKSLEKDIDFVIGISRGGLIPAVWVATHINKPLVAAYINKKDEIFIDRAEWIKDKRVLIVDDVIRSGKTFRKIREVVLDLKVRNIRPYFVFEDLDNKLKLPWDIYE